MNVVKKCKIVENKQVIGKMHEDMLDFRMTTTIKLMNELPADAMSC